MSVRELLEWWNLIYLLPLLLSVVWLVSMMLGGGHEGDGAHAAGHGLHDVGDLAHHLHMDAGHGADAGGHGAHDAAAGGASHHAGAHGAHDHAGSEDRGPAQGSQTSLAASLLGIGRTPITIVVGTLLLCWGAIGLFVNRMLGGSQVPGPVYILPSLAITAVASLVFTRLVSGAVGRVMPTTESYAVSHHGLVGRLGTVVYPVSETSGTVQVADASGTLHRLMARTAPGAAPIPMDRSILIVDLEESTGRYIVQESPSAVL